MTLFNLQWRLRPDLVKTHTLDSDAAWSLILATAKNLREPEADKALDYWKSLPCADLFEYRKVPSKKAKK